MRKGIGKLSVGVRALVISLALVAPTHAQPMPRLPPVIHEPIGPRSFPVDPPVYAPSDNLPSISNQPQGSPPPYDPQPTYPSQSVYTQTPSSGSYAAPRPPAPPIVYEYWPSSCVEGGVLQDTFDCDVVEAETLANELSYQNTDRLLHMMTLRAAHKIVLLSFGRQMTLSDRVRVVHTIYREQERQFQRLTDALLRAEADGQARQRLRRQYAMADSRAIQRLRAAAAAENRASVNESVAYLERTNRGGVNFQCRLACRQLVAAAQGINVFD